MSVGLFHCPSFAGEDHVAERTEVLAAADFGNLCLDFLIVGGGVDVADYAEGEGEVMTVHHGKLLVEEVGGGMRIVDKHIVHRVAILADLHGFEEETVAHETQFLILAEEHLLAVDEVDGAFSAVFLIGDEVVDTVVEDDAVLEDFYHGSTLVACGCNEDFLRNLELYIDAAGKEVAARAEYEFSGDEGILGSSVGR